jgi:hypothetical protein
MNTDKISYYMQKGSRDMFWYHECQKVFEELFGPDRLHLVCKLFAATSINTSLKSNITLFRRALYEIENGLPVGRYLPNIQNQLTRIRSGDELSGRKINSFAKAMSGDKDAVVVDIWLLRAFSMDRKYFRQKKGAIKGRGIYRSGGATDKQYTLIENYVRKVAKRKKVEARQVSSMIWAGVRMDTNGDKETHYKDILRSNFVNLFNVI